MQKLSLRVCSHLVRYYQKDPLAALLFDSNGVSDLQHQESGCWVSELWRHSQGNLLLCLKPQIRMVACRWSLFLFYEVDTSKRKPFWHEPDHNGVRMLRLPSPSRAQDFSVIELTNFHDGSCFLVFSSLYSLPGMLPSYQWKHQMHFHSQRSLCAIKTWSEVAPLTTAIFFCFWGKDSQQVRAHLEEREIDLEKQRLFGDICWWHSSLHIDFVSGYNDSFDTDPFDEEYEDYFGGEQDFQENIFDYIVEWMSYKNDSEKQRLGHQLEDLIIGCTYSQYSCNISRFVLKLVKFQFLL